ncbi:MAG: hypothetical protein MJ025_05885 [Victivallaceae bacterium]|nr:hypothetical protein [Victivallaceae bacterium]
MRRLLAGIMTTAFTLFAAFAVVAADMPTMYPGQKPQGGGGKKAAPIKGKKGDKIVLLHGGRPWEGDSTADGLVGCGLKVVAVTSPYLDGFGCATIKPHITDKVEPKANDGITPAFENLEDVKLVMVALIMEDAQRLMFDSTRVRQLRQYVEQGGHLLFDISAARELGDLLPVELGDEVLFNDVMVANRPIGNAFKMFPEEIPCYRVYRKAVLRPGAVALSTIRNAKGEEVAPLIARIKIGKGSVTFLNTVKRNPQQMKDFSNWAYSRAFLYSLAGDCFGKVVKPKMSTFPALPPHGTCGVEHASLLPPENAIVPDAREAKLFGRTIALGNGIRIVVGEKDEVSVTWPGMKTPVIKNFTAPRITFSDKQAVYDSATAEATEVKTDEKTADIAWKCTDVAVRGAEAVLTYKSGKNEIQWIFNPGRLELDGRKMEGFSERVAVISSAYRISGIKFSCDLEPVQPLYAHRNSCYSPPRGYTAFDMTGKQAKVDTWSWGMFSSGQPFEMLACAGSLYIAAPDGIQGCSPRMIRLSGKPIQSTRSMSFGRMKAPISTVPYWHWYGAGAERGHQDYIAMYQFMRSMLRRKGNLKELPGYPIARYPYNLTEDEMIEFERKAAAAGYRFIFPSNPESPIDQIASDTWVKRYNRIKALNARARIWTAGSYVQGDGGWIIRNHPEWFIRDEKGKFFQYFGKYPVIDVNEPAFYDWYTGILRKAIDAGVGWVYRDMDGAASGNANYAKDQSPSGLGSMVKFYKFFHDNDCRASVEGMNPLVLDEYWYRYDKYTDFTGKEFSLIGQMPSGDLKGGFALDPMRTAMYCCFPTVDMSGTLLGIEYMIGEAKRGERVLSLIPKFNEALDLCGMPYVRETKFGTVWTGEHGGVLFFWNSASRVTLDLPDGWKIRGVEGNVLTDVPADSIIFVDGKK